jgi:hypothetical protein
MAAGGEDDASRHSGPAEAAFFVGYAIGRSAGPRMLAARSLRRHAEQR